jgi:hypothetical protein
LAKEEAGGLTALVSPPGFSLRAFSSGCQDRRGTHP